MYCSLPIGLCRQPRDVGVTFSEADLQINDVLHAHSYSLLLYFGRLVSLAFDIFFLCFGSVLFLGRCSFGRFEMDIWMI